MIFSFEKGGGGSEGRSTEAYQTSFDSNISILFWKCVAPPDSVIEPHCIFVYMILNMHVCDDLCADTHAHTIALEVFRSALLSTHIAESLCCLK